LEKVEGKPKLEEFIRVSEVDALLIEKGESQRTLHAHELLKGLGFDVKPQQMIKALVCIPVVNGFPLIDRAVLAMVAGCDRLDLGKLARATSCDKVVIADQATAERLSGYPRGGTPPIGHAHAFRIVMDPVLAGQPVLFGGGGETTKVLRIAPGEIRRAALLRGEVFSEADIRE